MVDRKKYIIRSGLTGVSYEATVILSIPLN